MVRIAKQDSDNDSDDSGPKIKKKVVHTVKKGDDSDDDEVALVPPSAEGVFVYYDRDGDGYLTKEEFRKALQGAGASPSAEAFEKIWQEKSVKKKPNYEAFEKALKKLLKLRPKLDDFVTTFERISKNHKLDADLLKYIVTHYGEPLDETEAEELVLAAAPDKDGLVNIEKLALTLLDQANDE